MNRRPTIVVGVALMVVSILIVTTSILQWIDRTRDGTQQTLVFHGQSSSEAAIVTITNLKSHKQRWCGRGVVTSKSTGTSVISHPIYATIEPYSTVELRGPYTIGAVAELCPKESLIGKMVDWEKCDFDLHTLEDR